MCFARLELDTTDRSLSMNQLMTCWEVGRGCVKKKHRRAVMASRDHAPRVDVN